MKSGRAAISEFPLLLNVPAPAFCFFVFNLLSTSGGLTIPLKEGEE
jgi:hypothetical protein